MLIRHDLRHQGVYEMLENRPDDTGMDPDLVQKVRFDVSRSIAVRLRSEKGMSRSDVANLFGVSENTITNGPTPPRGTATRETSSGARRLAVGHGLPFSKS